MDTLYKIVSEAHSGNRWLVLLMAIAIVVDFTIGWITKKKFGRMEEVFSLVYMIAVDVQLLIGLSLYLFLSPTIRHAFAGGVDMSDAQTRLYVLEHPLTMILAIAFVHIGRVMVKKAASDESKFKKGLLWFGLALVFILSRMPW
jgi:hypothetical protein